MHQNWGYKKIKKKLKSTNVFKYNLSVYSNSFLGSFLFSVPEEAISSSQACPWQSVRF